MNHTAAPPSLPAASRLLISPDYARLWLGQAISLLGDAIFATSALLWVATRLAHGLSWAPLAVSALLIAGEAPELAAGPLAGVFVDRWDKRRTALAMDAVRALTLLLLLPLAVLPLHLPALASLAALYAAMAVITVAGQFFGPARLILIGDIVPNSRREHASSLAQSSAAVAAIAGPAVAAPLFLTAGPGWALALDLLSFLVSFAAIWSIGARPAPLKPTPTATPSVSGELRDGVRTILHTDVLRALLVAGVLISLAFGARDALGVFFLQHNLHASPRLFGLMSGALGLGGLAGAVLAGPIATRAGSGRSTWLAGLLLGASLIAFSRFSSAAPAFGALVLMGALFGMLEVAETPLLLRATPRRVLGRVVALLVPCYAAGNAVGALLAGWLASALPSGHLFTLAGMSFGRLDTLLAAGGLVAGAGSLYARKPLTSPASMTDP